MKQVSMKVVDNGGIIRSLQNHGTRQFPHRVQAKNPDYKTGQRYYEKGRFISVYYDANPTTQQQIQVFLGMNDQVLRQSHLRARSKLDSYFDAKPPQDSLHSSSFASGTSQQQ